jgi:hypothetical protein
MKCEILIRDGDMLLVQLPATMVRISRRGLPRRRYGILDREKRYGIPRRKWTRRYFETNTVVVLTRSKNLPDNTNTLLPMKYVQFRGQTKCQRNMTSTSG